MKTKFLIPLAGVALFCACKGYSPANSVDSTSADFQKEKAISSRSDTSHAGQKLVKTAGMRFKVKNVQQTSDQIAALTANCGGMVIHHFINTATTDSTNLRKSNDSLLRITVVNTIAEMTVRIPPAKMEDFVSQVARMGIMLNNMKMDINDKTLAYLSTRLKLKNEKELADNPGKGPGNLLDFKNHLVDKQISNLKTDDSVKNSTITLSFYESSVINKEIIANPDLSAYNFSFSTRLATAIDGGWHVFVEILLALAYFWVLIPISVVSWLVVRYYKRKKPVEMVKID